jgi:hypothetical protein
MRSRDAAPLHVGQWNAGGSADSTREG